MLDCGYPRHGGHKALSRPTHVHVLAVVEDHVVGGVSLKTTSSSPAPQKMYMPLSG